MCRSNACADMELSDNLTLNLLKSSTPFSCSGKTTKLSMEVVLRQIVKPVRSNVSGLGRLLTFIRTGIM